MTAIIEIDAQLSKNAYTGSIMMIILTSSPSMTFLHPSLQRCNEGLRSMHNISCYMRCTVVLVSQDNIMYDKSHKTVTNYCFK